MRKTDLAMLLVVLVGGAVVLRAGAAHTRSFAASSTISQFGATPCLSAEIAHEERRVLADGTTRDARYRERFYRCDDRVWTERVVPTRATGAESDHARDLPPLYRFAREVRRQSNGDPAVKLVSRLDKLIVDVDAPSYDAIAFTGSFESSASCVSREALSRMRRVASSSKDKGTWYDYATPEATARVLWSETLGVALVVESSRNDGTAKDRATLENVESPPREPAPWAAIASYTQKEFSDFGD
jgi:hypothetical protein